MNVSFGSGILRISSQAAKRMRAKTGIVRNASAISGITAAMGAIASRHVVGGFEAIRFAALHPAGIGDEVQVVHVIHRIRSRRDIGRRKVLAVYFRRALVDRGRHLPVAEDQPDMARHVDQVAGRRHLTHQAAARWQWRVPARATIPRRECTGGSPRDGRATSAAPPRGHAPLPSGRRPAFPSAVYQCQRLGIIRLSA